MPLHHIQGHRRIIDLLSRSIQRGTLPPSLIFAGSSASGARPTAIAVAQAFNCLEPRTRNPDPRDTNPATSNQQPATSRNSEPVLDACGVCAACVRIARGVHPDVPIVEPAETGLIRLDPVRDVIDRAAYRPFEGRRRVVIIDDADALLPQAQNALLKTLEEPTSSSVFILVTSKPDLLLPTVRSRCIRLSFARGAGDDVDADARDVAGRVLSHAATTRDAARRLDAARDLLTRTGAGGAIDREQLASHLRAMGALLRDIEVVGTGADAALLSNPDLKPELTHLADSYRGERASAAYAAVDRALAALDRNAGVKALADWVVLQL